MSNHARQPAGSPKGGQFATTGRTESDASLGETAAPSAPAGYALETLDRLMSEGRIQWEDWDELRTAVADIPGSRPDAQETAAKQDLRDGYSPSHALLASELWSYDTGELASEFCYVRDEVRERYLERSLAVHHGDWMRSLVRSPSDTEIEAALACIGCLHEGMPLPDCPQHGQPGAMSEALRNVFRASPPTSTTSEENPF